MTGHETGSDVITRNALDDLAMNGNITALKAPHRATPKYPLHHLNVSLFHHKLYTFTKQSYLSGWWYTWPCEKYQRQLG